MSGRAGAYSGKGRSAKRRWGPGLNVAIWGAMSEPSIRDFHAHIYYDPEQVDDARRWPPRPSSASRRGRPFPRRPVGPHPRGSCQLTVPPELFGDVAQWLTLNRGRLTIFAHANTGEDLPDHTQHVIWFGPSEPLDLSIFELSHFLDPAVGDRARRRAGYRPAPSAAAWSAARRLAADGEFAIDFLDFADRGDDRRGAAGERLGQPAALRVRLPLVDRIRLLADREAHVAGQA